MREKPKVGDIISFDLSRIGKIVHRDEVSYLSFYADNPDHKHETIIVRSRDPLLIVDANDHWICVKPINIDLYIRVFWDSPLMEDCEPEVLNSDKWERV